MTDYTEHKDITHLEQALRSAQTANRWLWGWIALLGTVIGALSGHITTAQAMRNTASDVEHRVEENYVPRTEMSEITKRLDSAIARLDKAVSELQRIDIRRPGGK